MLRWAADGQVTVCGDGRDGQGGDYHKDGLDDAG